MSTALFTNQQIINQFCTLEPSGSSLWLNSESGVFALNLQNVQDIAWKKFAEINASCEMVCCYNEDATVGLFQSIGNTLFNITLSPEYQAYLLVMNTAFSHMEPTIDQPYHEMILNEPHRGGLTSLFFNKLREAYIKKRVYMPEQLLDPLAKFQLQMDQIRKMTQNIEIGRRVIQFILMNQDMLKTTANTLNTDVYIHAFDDRYYENVQDGFFKYKSSEFPSLRLKDYFLCSRSIVLTKDGRIYIICSKKNDLRVGKGGTKTVKTAVRIDKAECIRACSSMEFGCAKPDIKAELLLIGVQSVLTSKCSFAYSKFMRSKPGVVVKKYRMITHHCNLGSLRNALLNNYLTSEDRFNCLKQIIDIVYDIHVQKKCLIRDVTTGNFFAERIRGVLNVYFGDLGSVCEETDEVSKQFFAVTYMFCAPEMCEILKSTKHYHLQPYIQEDQKVKFGSLINRKTDMWSLGSLLHELFIGFLPSTPKIFNTLEARHEAEIDYTLKAPDGYIQRDPSNPVHTLIYHLLRKDPADRFTIEQARDFTYMIPEIQKIVEKNRASQVDSAISVTISASSAFKELPASSSAAAAATAATATSSTPIVGISTSAPPLPIRPVATSMTNKAPANAPKPDEAPVYMEDVPETTSKSSTTKPNKRERDKDIEEEQAAVSDSSNDDEQKKKKTKK